MTEYRFYMFYFRNIYFRNIGDIMLSVFILTAALAHAVSGKMLMFPLDIYGTLKGLGPNFWFKFVKSEATFGHMRNL